MTAPTGTFTAANANGKREDLVDAIYNIAPWETPFLSGVEAVDATAILHQWQTDSLAAASATNFKLEGSDEDSDSATATTVLSNTCSISAKYPRVSGTLETVAKAGRRSELAYQIAKRGKELKRDMETILLSNNAEVTGDSPRELGSITAWIDTNTSNGSGGSDGSAGNTARTDGTARAFTEALLKPVLKSIADSGGMPDTIMLGTFNRQKFSEFTGNSTRMVDAKDEMLATSVDLYKYEFGMLEVKSNLFQRANDALILQMDMWAVAYLRPFVVEELAKTGDSKRVMLLAEYTLESRNEAASGAVWDLTTS